MTVPAGPPPRVVPRIVPCVPAEAPAPAADREAGPEGVVGIVVPAVVPRAVGRAAPRAEHRGDVLGFDPHFVARDDDVVEGRIVGRGVGEGAAVAEVEVTRRHAVGGRLEAAQAACVGAFVVVGQDAPVGIRLRGAVFVVFSLRGRGLRFGQPCLPLGLAGLGGDSLGFGLGLLPAGDLRLVVDGVEVIRSISRACPVGRRTSRRAGDEQQASDQMSYVFHGV